MNASGGEIHLQSLEREDLPFRFLGLSSTEYGIDTHHQFFGREGLDHVIIDPHFETMDLIIFLSTSRKHQDRRIHVLADFFHCRKPIQFRHHHIHEDDIVGRGSRFVYGLQTIGGFGDFMSIETGIFHDQFTNFRFIIYHKDLVNVVLLQAGSSGYALDWSWSFFMDFGNITR